MKAKQIFIALFFLLSFSTVFFAQDDFEQENWLRDLGGLYTGDYYVFYHYKYYTKDDLPVAKERLNAIKQAGYKDEWEGIYAQSTSVGDQIMVWNEEKGFFEFYFYHGLQTMDFGRTAVSGGVIELISEKPSRLNNPNRRKSARIVKVKVGERHFLVPENYLKEFCEIAVGLRQISVGFGDFWIKTTEWEKPVFGLPVVPAEYQRFVREPIHAEIIKTGEKKMFQEKTEDGTVYNEEIHHYVTLDAGKNKHVKPEMDFYVADLDEWIEIKNVAQNTSVGVIIRRFDDNKHEQCLSGRKGSENSTPCKAIKVGMKTVTKYD